MCSIAPFIINEVCKFPLSWGWMHRKIKLSMYFSEVWLTVCQSEQGRQAVCAIRRATGVKRLPPPTADHTGPGEKCGNAEAQRNTKAIERLSFLHPSLYKSLLYLLVVHWIEERAVPATQSAGRDGWKCLHQFLIFRGSSKQSCHLWGDLCWIIHTGGVSLQSQTSGLLLAALFTFSPKRTPRDPYRHGQISCFLIHIKVDFNWKHISGEFTSTLTVNNLAVPFLSLTLSLSLNVSIDM